jgi:GT2 family glycosyltransferase
MVVAGGNGMIAVIIVDYHSEVLTRRALSSLVALGRDDLSFIVVDNGAASRIDCLEGEFHGLRVLRPGRNEGFAAGCNLGMAEALHEGADYFLLLNPDTRAEGDFVGPMLKTLQQNSEVAVVGPTIVEDDEVREVTDGGGIVNWWTGDARGVTGRRMQADGSYVEVPFTTGAAMLIRAQAAAEVGPMDEGYFLYFEDTDYCQAFLKAGWKIGYVPEAELLHATSSVAGRKSEPYLYYFARNRIRFMRRCGGWHHRLVFTLFNSFVRLPVMLVLYGIVRRRPLAALAIWRGFVDGLRGRSGPAPLQSV